MIDTNTVFILGAGASKPYEFPTAVELKENILKIDIGSAFNAANEPTGETHNPIWKYVFDKCGVDNIYEFFESFKDCAETSIDAFIEYRPKFLDIGNILISIKLIENESIKYLFEADNNWYQYIYNKIKTNFEDFEKNNVSFITFNYDRSLEQYLLTSIKKSYGKTEKEAAQKLKSIPIIHLYGILGNLPALAEENIREYNQNCDKELIKVAAENIKIIPKEKDIENDNEFQRAHQLISDARMICFLGFGYNEINLSRLKLKDLLTRKHLVFGSTYGFVKGEIDGIKSWFGNDLVNGEICLDETGKLDCLGFLRSIANFI